MQKIISLKNVTYSIHERPILQGITLKCADDERLCIFGENGTGKSTLLKLIQGELVVDSGLIEKQGHVRCVYVEQEFPQIYNSLSVEGYIKDRAGEVFLKKVSAYAEALGFSIKKYGNELCGSLSGGQQKALSLSVAFALAPDFLLLDEPENHLDIVSRVELVSLLKGFKGGIIFVSHDRLLIDNISTKIAEIAQGSFHVSEGDYDDYIKAKMDRIGGLQRQYDARSKRIKQLNSTIVILKQKAIRGLETSAYHKAQEELDELKEAQKENGRPDDKKTKINIRENASSLPEGKLLVRMKAGQFQFENAKSRIFDEVDLEIRSGQNIALLGRNASGKSTLLRSLIGQLKLAKGEVIWGPGVSWTYFDQHSVFDLEKTALMIISDSLNLLPQDARAALGAMKLDATRMDLPVKDLSGGEKMRLRFAIVFGLKHDLIIFDEPTNHIDETTWEILLEACKNSKSTILLVSHDYEFIEAFKPNLFWVIKDQRVAVRHKELDVLIEEMKG